MPLFVYVNSHTHQGWRMKDHHWEALAESGWDVHWGGPGQQQRTKGERFEGTLALAATKSFSKREHAILQWEALTQMSLYEKPCSCCAPPHAVFEAYWLDEDDLHG